MSLSPYNVYVCPNCGSRYKEVKANAIRKYHGVEVIVKNAPHAQCAGDPSKKREGCGYKEIVSAEVLRNIEELTKTAVADVEGVVNGKAIIEYTG